MIKYKFRETRWWAGFFCIFCHCEKRGGLCGPRDEAIACYTGRRCKVRDCFPASQRIAM